MPGSPGGVRWGGSGESFVAFLKAALVPSTEREGASSEMRWPLGDEALGSTNPAREGLFLPPLPQPHQSGAPGGVQPGKSHMCWDCLFRH